MTPACKNRLFDLKTNEGKVKFDDFCGNYSPQSELYIRNKRLKNNKVH